MFLLDIRYDRKTKKITKWIKDKNVCRPVREAYFPKIYISGIVDLPFLDKVPGIIDIHFEEKSIALGRQPEKVICATVDPNFIYDITSMLDFHGCRIYNVDISAVRQYLLEKKLFPMANLTDCFQVDDDQYALDYNVNIISKDLSVIPKIRGIFTFEDQIDSIYFGNDIIEGREKYIIEKLNSAILESDPDIIFTNNGDSFELPYLYYRASLYDIRLQLGREKDIENIPNNNKGTKINGRSYFSYGKIYYKPRGHYLSGRLHIDRSSFLFREGGLSGIIDISRITGIPLQELSRLSPGGAVNALQANQALRDDVLIQRNCSQKNIQEILETTQQSALILEPKVGLHERIYELDFISVFPNIMVNHNISPETVLCDCCPNGEKVPFLDYNICQKNIGLIPRVLRPLIDRRLTYKMRAKDMNQSLSEEYEKKQKVLKWLLVTSFGYMGFNKAQFGSMKCYDSITAYARDILLRTIKLSQDSGYEVLHGLVDCVWIKGPPPEKLQKIITEDVGIGIECKGFYNWIVFLPNKSDANGSPYRYYGLMDNGKLKIRGIELRQRSTPGIIRNLQEDILNKLAEAKTAQEFYKKIPEAVNILKCYARKVADGECMLSDLIFEIRISKELDRYKGLNNSVAALWQYKDNNIDILPGQFVRYIITDFKSKNRQRRVIIPELANETTKYDKEKYYNYLLNATESILLPFGYSTEYLDGIMKKNIQAKLYQYG
jgi:DNA polymerase elongation subunit (family B)